MKQTRALHNALMNTTCGLPLYSLGSLIGYSTKTCTGFLALGGVRTSHLRSLPRMLLCVVARPLRTVFNNPTQHGIAQYLGQTLHVTDPDPRYQHQLVPDNTE